MTIIQNQPAQVSIGKSIILSIVTCGIYTLFWNYSIIQTINELLGREEITFWKWLLFGVITCGIYSVYCTYKKAVLINEIKHKNGMLVGSDLPILSVALYLFALFIVVDAIHQSELNKIINHNSAKV